LKNVAFPTLIGVILTTPSMAQQRLNVGASLAAVEVYDDNLFATPEAPEQDNVWRLSPRLGFGRRWPRLTLTGRYGLDAESFRRHRALDTPLAAQEASFDMSWTPSRRVALATTATYAEAQSPAALNLLSGLEVGRHRGSRLFGRQSFSWAMGARTKAVIEPSFTREVLEGFARVDTTTASLRLERRLGAVDLTHVTYGARRFDFGDVPILSHVFLLGWSREITPRAHFEVEAGPRLSERAWGAEVSASLTHQFARGEARLTYVHTQTTVLGQVGPVLTQGMNATFRRELFRSLTLAAGPGFAIVQGRGSEFEVYRWSLDLAWRLNRRLALAASQQFNFQSGVPGLARTDAEIVHNVFMLRAVALAGN
jgi:hypothetical protein